MVYYYLFTLYSCIYEYSGNYMPPQSQYTYVCFPTLWKCKLQLQIWSQHHLTQNHKMFHVWEKQKDFTCCLNAYFKLCCMCGYSKFTLCRYEIAHVLSLNRDQLCFCILYRPENQHLSDFLTQTSVSYTGSLRWIVLKVPFMGQMSQSLKIVLHTSFFPPYPIK